MRSARGRRRLGSLLAALLAAAGAAGCGGAHPRQIARAATGSPPYHWLIDAQGEAPSIAQENAQPGTRGWRLPGPQPLIGGEARGAIAGYVSRQSLAPGQQESVYVAAPHARWVMLRVYRMGWYGGRGGRLVLASRALPTVEQPPCAHDASTGLTECDWRPTITFTPPRTLASGVFVVRLRASTGAHSDCIFVLRPSRPPRVLVEIPTATWEAYNAWGGDSLYPGGTERVTTTGSTQGVEVSYERPYESQTGAGQFFIREIAAVRFLERYGYAVGYTTVESLGADPAQLDGVRAFVDVGHSEYWSAAAQRALAAALRNGTSLLFLSSDTMAWRVRFASSRKTRAQAQRMVAYKQFATTDPDRSEPTGPYPGGGAQLTGSAYNGCTTQRVAAAGPPRYRYYDWRPSPQLQPAWLFARTGVTARSVIPGIVGYELDERSASSPPGTLVLGGAGGVPCMSETEPSPVRGTNAQSTLYVAPSGAFVFASGTLGWLYGLSPVPQASPDVPREADSRVVAMTRNLLAHALGGGSARRCAPGMRVRGATAAARSRRAPSCP